MFKPYFVRGETFLVKFINETTCSIFMNDEGHIKQFVAKFDNGDQRAEFADYASNVDELTIKFIPPVNDSYHPAAPKYEIICDDVKYSASNPFGSYESHNIEYLRALTEFMEGKLQDQTLANQLMAQALRRVEKNNNEDHSALFFIKLFLVVVSLVLLVLHS